tara:strand:- start:3016 stop:3879 length:864 start_codon:yes stop_codon:yes gene_type:complete
MNSIKYFFQFIIIILFLIFFKLLGLNYSTFLSGKFLRLIGPLFRSNRISHQNLIKAFPNLDKNQRQKILDNMWNNYGKILAEYVFIKKFRNSTKFSNKIIIENQEELEKIKDKNEKVIFISGHFNNFELMAMHIEKSGIDLAAVYRPLNNYFLNPIMEKIRKKYICKKQIKKGISGMKQLLIDFKNGYSIALMIDQRVSQGIKVNFFNEKAFTTSIPAQFVKKFRVKIIPVYIERIENTKFKLKFYKALQFKEEDTIESITLSLNKVLEKMILKNPDQWIWTHNRWK